MSDTAVTTRRTVYVAGTGIARILIAVAAVLMAIAFCMCLGFLFEKPSDLLNVLAIFAASWTLFFVAHL